MRKLFQFDFNLKKVLTVTLSTLILLLLTLYWVNAAILISTILSDLDLHTFPSMTQHQRHQTILKINSRTKDSNLTEDS